MLHQEPSPSESIPPHVARPYIQALNTITLQTLHPEHERGQKVTEKAAGRLEQESGEVSDEASQLEELVSVMEQVISGRFSEGCSDLQVFCRSQIKTVSMFAAADSY